MIKLTRLDGEAFILNADLIKATGAFHSRARFLGNLSFLLPPYSLFDGIHPFSKMLVSILDFVSQDGVGDATSSFGAPLGLDDHGLSTEPPNLVSIG